MMEKEASIVEIGRYTLWSLKKKKVHIIYKYIGNIGIGNILLIIKKNNSFFFF